MRIFGAITVIQNIQNEILTDLEKLVQLGKFFSLRNLLRVNGKYTSTTFFLKIKEQP